MASRQDARGADMIGHRSDGGSVQRPLSPHLQVYDMLQMSSALSIMHRITGIGWSAGLLLLTWWLLAAAAGPDAYARAAGVLGSWIGLLVLVGMTAAGWYHTLNGVRHLTWDAGYGFTIPEMYRSGWAVLAVTALLTLLTWVVAVVVWR